jgi:tetratricopeptide (TPR) repeat protein
MNGEWRATGVVRIVSVKAALAQAEKMRDASLAAAAEGNCEEAREAFRNATRHVARNERWANDARPEVETAVVACYVARTRALKDPLSKAALIRAPNHVQAQEHLAGFLLEGGAVEEAMIRCRSVLAIDPSASRAALDLARAHALLGAWARARSYLERLPVGNAGREMLWARLRLWNPAFPAAPPVPHPPPDASLASRIPFEAVRLLGAVHDGTATDPQMQKMLEDGDPAHVQWAEDAYRANALGRPHLDTRAGRRLANISSLAFGGPDLRTAYLGCLLGDSIATFRTPVAGHPPVHWTW